MERVETATRVQTTDTKPNWEAYSLAGLWGQQNKQGEVQTNRLKKYIEKNMGPTSQKLRHMHGQAFPRPAESILKKLILLSAFTITGTKKGFSLYIKIISTSKSANMLPKESH